MLAKLSVLLGCFVTVSLGEALDCSEPPRGELCCSNFLKFVNVDFMDCSDRHIAPGDLYIKSLCEVITCVMRKKDYILSDDKINRAALAKFVKQNLTDYAPSIETALEECYTDTEKSKCTPKDFVFCAGNALMKECPAASWKKTEYCRNLKNYFNNCPNSSMFTDVE